MFEEISGNEEEKIKEMVIIGKKIENNKKKKENFNF